MLATVALPLDLERSQAVTSIGHAGGADGIGDQDRPLRAFGAQKHSDHAGIHVNAIDYDVGGYGVVGKHCSQDPWITMVEGAHGIESMGCMVGAGSDGRGCLIESGVGVCQAGMDAQAAPPPDRFNRSSTLTCHRS